MTTIFKRLLRKILNPLSTVDWLSGNSTEGSVLLNDQLPPDQALRRYARLARRQGIPTLLLALSFDCDTPEDAAAAESLDPILRGKGIKTTYAVPGEMLLLGRKVYRRIADYGAHFINHGSLPHAQWHESRYRGITFYDKMTTEEVVRDIKEGHRIVEEVIGKPPQGFRAPHFGSYQRPEQLAVIYRTARALGYSFCTTTLPNLALNSGPAILVDGGLYEFPLSGSLQSPLTIFDSWNYLADYEKLILKEEYFDLFVNTVNYFLTNRLGGVLNLYVDPSHVVDASPFHEAIDYVVSKNITSLHYSDLIALVKGAS
jgi:peptidoglycan/xylan/chitin deacetylase (PgdA/CDA1 family)